MLLMSGHSRAPTFCSQCQFFRVFEPSLEFPICLVVSRVGLHDLVNVTSRCSVKLGKTLLLVCGNVLADHVLENLCERQVKSIYTHDAHDDLKSARHCAEKGAEKPPNIA